MTLKTPKDLALEARKLGKKSISYSQIKQFTECPHRWKLRYIDGHKERKPSIHTVFGTAMHETIQHYVEMVYKASAKAADEFDHHSYLKERMRAQYKVEIDLGVEQFSSAGEMNEFYLDGVEIIDFLKKKRRLYFGKKNTEFLGSELPILVETDANNNVLLMGFVDLVLKEHGKIRIIDIKTSRSTWSKQKKKAEGLQLRLYKRYFAKQYDVDESDIVIEYLIVKRKIWANSDFPQSRIQQYNPAAGKPSINKAEKVLSTFVNKAFDTDGKKIKTNEYKAVSGPKARHCGFCPYKNNYELCPVENRIQTLSE